MTDLLVKLFVKDYEQTENLQVRTRYGLLSGMVGICCNVLLFLAKLFTGMMINSISVMADAFNNLSDAASSIISFVGVKMSEKPADKEHPFGHGRIEYISAFIVAFLVIQVGFSLFKSSLGKLFHPEELSFSLISVGILGLTVAVKLWMCLFNRKLGKRIQSSVMLATAADSLGDTGATAATIFSIVVYGVWHVNIDGLVGIAVSILVMIAGINIAKDTLAPLIGEAIDPEIYQKITEFVEQYDGIIGSHDLIVHNYGPGRVYASLHAEVPANMDMMEAHDYIDMAERRVEKRMKCFISIHMDPVVTDDEVINHLRKMTAEVVKSVGEELNIHDFRTVKGPYITNLIFDVLVPYNYHLSDDEIKTQIQKKITEKQSECRAVIKIDKSYTG